MKQKPGVMIYFDIIPVLDLLSSADAGILFRAILQYGENGVLPELEPNLALLWPLIQQRLDRDWDRYQATVIKRKYAAYSRWEKKHEREPLPFAHWVEARGYEQNPEEEIDALA